MAHDRRPRSRSRSRPASAPASLLLKSGYRFERERYGPLDVALWVRCWDLFDLLLDCGGNLKSVDVYTVLGTCNAELYERFRAAGHDLTERHEMAASPK